MKRNAVWQWIWCWLGVLVAGCAARSGTGTSVPLSALPLATLPRLLPTLPPFTPIWRVIRPALGGTATNTASQDSTPPLIEPGQSPTRAVTSLPVLPALILEPLACYPALPGGWWCLGALRNPLDVPCVGAVVQITLLDLKNAPLVALNVPAVRPLIRPGEEIPYSVLFRDAPESIGGATVALIGGIALPAPDSTEPGSIALTIGQVTYESAGLVRGLVANPTNEPVMISAIATLFDADEHVLGYRQINDSVLLAAGESRSIVVVVMPLINDVRVARVALVAEGHRN